MVPCRCSAMTRASSGSPASRTVYPRALRISELSCRTPFSSSTSSTVSVPRGTETVLLVEDEKGVRQLSSEILRARGYTVLEAGDPLEALVIAEQRHGTIDLLLTDMMMPGMRGSELADRLEPGSSPPVRGARGFRRRVVTRYLHTPPRRSLESSLSGSHRRRGPNRRGARPGDSPVTPPAGRSGHSVA